MFWRKLIVRNKHVFSQSEGIRLCCFELNFGVMLPYPDKENLSSIFVFAACDIKQQTHNSQQKHLKRLIIWLEMETNPMPSRPILIGHEKAPDCVTTCNNMLCSLDTSLLKTRKFQFLICLQEYTFSIKTSYFEFQNRSLVFFYRKFYMIIFHHSMEKISNLSIW